MTPSQSLHKLASFVESLESADSEIEHVQMDDGGLIQGGPVTATARVSHPLLAKEQSLSGLDFEVTNASVDGTGRLQLDLAVSIADDRLEASTDGGAVASEREESSNQSTSNDETSQEEASTPSYTEQDGTDTEASETVPAYQDPVQLRAVYAEYDTFAEMTDALGVDVTPQTVRRHMMDHEIHEPMTQRDNSDSRQAEASDTETGESTATDSTASDEPTSAQDETTDWDDEHGPSVNQQRTDSPLVHSADGEPMSSVVEDVDIPGDIVFPEHLAVLDVIEAVETARTLHEAHRYLNLDRDEAMQLLKDLNLLELVHGRLATTANHDLSREDIVQRIVEGPPKRQRAI